MPTAQRLVAAESQLAPLPEPTVSFAQGAALGVPYGTAHYALFGRGRAVAGERVLVHGASGAVGLAALQLAKAAGLKPYGTAGSDSQDWRRCSRRGAEKAFDHRKAGLWGRDRGAGPGPKRINLIVEMLANVNLDKDAVLAGAQRAGSIVVGSRGRVEIDPRAIMGKDAPTSAA